MITVIPRKITATSVNGVTVANDGSITLPVDNAPTTNSTNLVTSGGVKTELDALSARIGNAENPAQVWTDVSFTIPTSNWSLSNNKYTAVVQSSSILATSGVFVNYDSLDAATAPITAEESTGQVTFTTNTIPTGTITGTFRIVDSVNGIVPIARGGTGTDNLADALTALGAVAKTGDTITGEINLTRENGFPSIKFQRLTDPDNGPQQLIQSNETGTGSVISFYQRINGNSSWEGFRFPSTTESITGSNKVYEILTSKTFNPGEDFTSKISFSVGANNCKATKQGNICVIEYQSEGFTGTARMTLFTLPEGYRPTITTYFGAFIDTSLVPALVELSNTGTVKLHTASSYPTNKRIYLNFSYSCA